jgi:hypothetical protein
MNKNLVTTATGIVILALGAFGCQDSGKKYRYEVSGVVEAVQTDYECGEDLALEPAAFVAGKGGGGSSGKKSGTSGSGSNADGVQQGGDSGRVAATKPPNKKAEAPSPRRTSQSPATSRPNSGAPQKSGVQLSKKPAKPKRVTKIVPPKGSKRPEGCETEYEVFVRNSDGLFEQDVRKVDYDHCSDQVREPFPACTEN